MAWFDGLLLDALKYGVLVLSLWALVDAITRPAAAFVAASKLNKPAWIGITALAAVFAYLSPALQLFWLLAAVGAVVYLVDVRPAVRGLPRGGSSPW